jgi:hypothetical protein
MKKLPLDLQRLIKSYLPKPIHPIAQLIKNIFNLKDKICPDDDYENNHYRCRNHRYRQHPFLRLVRQFLTTKRFYDFYFISIRDTIDFTKTYDEEINGHYFFFYTHYCEIDGVFQGYSHKYECFKNTLFENIL